jgi:hypothetical protein
MIKKTVAAEKKVADTAISVSLLGSARAVHGEPTKEIKRIKVHKILVIRMSPQR